MQLLPGQAKPFSDRKKSCNRIYVRGIQRLNYVLGRFIEDQIRKQLKPANSTISKGSRRPLDLDSYFATPEDLRMGYSVLKSNKFVPLEVDMLKEIGELKEKVKDLHGRCRKEKARQDSAGKNSRLYDADGTKPAAKAVNPKALEFSNHKRFCAF
jgi:hypothetical protein